MYSGRARQRRGGPLEPERLLREGGENHPSMIWTGRVFRDTSVR